MEYFTDFSPEFARMGEQQSEELRAMPSNHVQFRNRVQKTLYYGQYSDKSLPSLAVTDVAVDVLGSVVPSKKKCLDTNYATVVSRRAKISPCALMMGMLYTERLQKGNPDYLKRVSSSDLFLISVLVASKYLYDEGEEEEVFNDDWAKAGSKTVNDVNKLEMEFLSSIDWNLFVKNEEFLDFVNKVESRVATNLGLCRGWFTYGDLSTLLDNARFLKTLVLFRHEMLKVVFACALAYLLSLSLALSLATIARRHVYGNHVSKYHSTPSASTPLSPCSIIDATCRFQPASALKESLPDVWSAASMGGRLNPWINNSSQDEERHVAIKAAVGQNHLMKQTGSVALSSKEHMWNEAGRDGYTTFNCSTLSTMSRLKSTLGTRRDDRQNRSDGRSSKHIRGDFHRVFETTSYSARL